MTVGILFVCTGNTCRSPMAAGVLRGLAQRAGIGDAIEIDSAGAGVRAAGRPASPLALQAAGRRGYDIAGHRTRALVAADLSRFDYCLAMARPHLRALQSLAPPDVVHRPRMLLAFAPASAVAEVADPYGGTSQDYESALDLVEAGCRGLVAHLSAVLAKPANFLERR